ncbi:MAG: sigma-70 family RNA polymerase sigma factor [Actinomycetota bacterium]|nr:sigma-70 family RNA polymerase sigma factor [Actinomycetota bacterium]
MDLEAVEEAELASAEAAVRQFLRSRLLDGAEVDDLTQETLVRVLDVRHRFQRAVSIPYAVTVAKHLVIARARSNTVANRHIHRLAAEPVAPAAEDLVLSRQDTAALRAALRALPDDERDLLLAHVVDEDDTASLAARTGGTAGGVAAKLSRVRAKARVDYVVAANRVTLPSAQCRPVLLSLSAADRRRQTAVHAADHLVECSVCADLSPQLVERRRSIAALLPIPIIARLAGAIRALVRAHPVASVGGALGVVTVAAAAVVASSAAPHRQTAAPIPAPRPSVTAAPSSAPQPTVISRPTVLDVPTLLPLSPTRWRQLAGRRVVAKAVPVLSVPADEGFWVGDSATKRRIWVQLETRGESRVHVIAGHRVSFTGRLRLHGPGFARAVGVDDAEGGSELTSMGAHLEVDAAKLVTTQ